MAISILLKGKRKKRRKGRDTGREGERKKEGRILHIICLQGTAN